MGDISAKYAIPKIQLWVFGIFLALLYFPIFLHLDSIPIKEWDESLFALRAHHLAAEGHLLANFNEYENLPDHINTKPPFTTLFQALSFKIFGYSELALRLPIAFLVLATCLALFQFCRTQLGSDRAGYFSALTLLCAGGYLETHIARSGDQDAALAFYQLLAFMAVFMFFEGRKNRQGKYLIYLGLAAAAAVLTKSFAGFFFLPGILLYALLRGELGSLLRNSKTWISAGIALALIAFCYLLMELNDPGLLERVFLYEGVNRFGSTLENHRASFGFFIDLWVHNSFVPWIYFIPLGFIASYNSQFERFRPVFQLASCMLIPFVLIISSSQTKLIWYDAPAYPLLALMSGLSIYMISEVIREHLMPNSWSPTLSMACFSFLLFALPYWSSVEKVYKLKNRADVDQFGYMFRAIDRHHKDIRDYKVYLNSFGTGAGFYREMYSQKGHQIAIHRNDEFKTGDIVMACNPSKVSEIQKTWDYELLRSEEQCRLFRLREKRSEIEMGIE
jgi:4-amino-4-deoxy-L-arabinose transferase-like glycosyltransferase